MSLEHLLPAASPPPEVKQAIEAASEASLLTLLPNDALQLAGGETPR